ncbi:nucleoside diphosphate kinase II [Citrus sinensis]|nr:nucleoside diphosphate kinase II [Citrus sinensis]KAH9720719.1 nucleoside diphosphate kinase II [Citrus sinensis]
MEGVGALGVSSSPTLVGKISCSRRLSYSSNKLTLRTTSHLAAFHPQSHLFVKFPPCPQRKTVARNSNETGIFLPHLVASMEQVEETYIMVKPDGVQRGLVGDIISRFEKKGFKLTGLKLFQCPKDLAEACCWETSCMYGMRHFIKLYVCILYHIFKGMMVIYVIKAWEGAGVVASARKLIGSTDPLQAEPGTIRGDLAVQTGRNVVHGSDSPENGKREIGLWFKEGELCQWTPAQAQWLRE